MGFFGELYLRSTVPFLSEEVTQLEADYLARCFAEARGPLLDLGCGHGRHAWRLTPRFEVVGVDLDPLSLEEAPGGFQRVRADFFRLPFRDASLGGAWGWYNALFTFEDAVQPLLFAEVARVLKPGARFVVQTGQREHFIKSPQADYDGRLPDGSRLVERVRYDAQTHRDAGRRELHFPDGRVVAADYFIRYYSPDELRALLEPVGFRVDFVHGAVDGSPFGPSSMDLIVGASRA